MSDVYPAHPQPGRVSSHARRRNEEGGRTVSKLDEHADDALFAVFRSVRSEQKSNQASISREDGRGRHC